MNAGDQIVNITTRSHKWDPGNNNVIRTSLNLWITTRQNEIEPFKLILQWMMNHEPSVGPTHVRTLKIQHHVAHDKIYACTQVLVTLYTIVI